MPCALCAHKQLNYIICFVCTGFPLSTRFCCSVILFILSIFIIWGFSFSISNPQKPFFLIIIFYYNNKLILSRAILLSDIKMAPDHSYSYYQNTTSPTCCIISESTFYYVRCTQLDRLCDIKKFLGKKLECVSRVCEKIDI